MAIAHKKAGFQRTKFEGKSLKEKAKILEKHYNNLGYKVPQYIQNGNMTTKQFNNAYNKINNGYENKVFKEQLTKKKLTTSTINTELNKTVNMYNKKVDRVLNDIQKNLNLSELELRYLKGEQLKLTLRSKSFIKDSDVLKHIDLENTFFKTNRERLAHLKMLKKEMNNLTTKKFIAKLKDTSKQDNWFSNMLNDKFLDDLDENSKELLLKYFNKLSPLQKELVIKGELGELRQKYQAKFETDLATDVSANYWNRTKYIIEQVYLETMGEELVH